MTIDIKYRLGPTFEEYDRVANICSRVYSQGPFNQKIFGYKTQKMFKRSNGLANLRALKNDNEIILVFRGTRTFEDWICNFKCFPKNIGLAGHKIWVHSGFMGRLNEPVVDAEKSEKAELNLKEIVNKYLSLELGDRDLILCGHSLGGALAMLLSQELHESHKSKVKAIFTFGQPAVGLRSFADNYCFKDKTFRMCSGIDAVTFLPGPFYKHVGYSLWFHDDDFYLDEKWYTRIYRTIVDAFTSIYKDHSMDKYIKKGHHFNR